MQRILSRLTVLLVVTALVGACASSQPFRGMDVDEVMRTGVEAFENEDYEFAVQAFERVLFSSPGYERAPEARHLLARSFFRREQYVTAASEYTRFLDRFPTHEMAPDAALGVCRSYVELSPIVERDQSHTRQALTSCRSVAREYAGTEEGRRGAELAARMENKLARKVLNGGQFYLKRKMFDSAIIYFEDVVENYPDTDVVPRALKGLVEANTAIGYQQEAEDWRQQLLQEYPDSEAAREVRSNRANGDAG